MAISFEIISRGSGKVAETCEGVVVLFDLENRCTVTIPGELRKMAQQHVKADFL